MVSSVQVSVATSYAAVESPPSTSCGASPEARVLALMVHSQLAQGDSARTSIKLSEEQLQRLRETIREALAEAREAQDDSGFWGDIGDVLGGDIATLAQVVAMAAACVATGGAAAIALTAIAVACTVASKYADELGIPPKVAIGIALAAAVTSIASGQVGGAAQGMSLVGASGGAVQTGSSVAQVSKLTQLAKDVASVARIVAPAASAAGAIAQGVSGYYEGEAAHRTADAQAARNRETLEGMDLDAAIDLLARAIDRELAAFEAANEIAVSNQYSDQLIVHTFAGKA
jgi:hypothetical protein